MKYRFLPGLALLCLGLFVQPLWSQQPSSANTDSTVNTMVEIMPEYPGGQEAMYAFLLKNLKYPKEARKEKISGVVYVLFVINADGNIAEQSILKSPHQSLSDEALRVIGKMPAWKPGFQQGKAVRVKMTLPIRFTLPDDDSPLDPKKTGGLTAKQLKIHSERAEQAYKDKAYKECLYHLIKLKEGLQPTADYLVMEADCLAALGDDKLACETISTIPENKRTRSVRKKMESYCQ